MNFQYSGCNHSKLYCSLTIEAWLKLNMYFECRYLKLWNACVPNLVYIELNISDGIDSKYPSIVFLNKFTIIII